MPRLNNDVARQSLAGLEQILRGKISSGEYAPGELLPGVRTLSERHGVGRRLVQAAMRALEEDALVSAEPRRGYRVLEPREESGRGAAVAFVVPKSESSKIATYHRELFDQLQQVAGAKGHPLLAVGGGGVTPEEVVGHLRSNNVRGAVVNGYDPVLLAGMGRLGIPIAAVDVWHPDIEADAVIQDGFMGGYLAAQHLVETGHERIAYVGRKVPREMGLLASDRLGGALAGVIDGGVDLPERMRVLDDGIGGEPAGKAIERMLGDRRRPTAAIALWESSAMMVARVAGQLGLKLGTDLDVVTWRAEERTDSRLVELAGGYRPAVVTWSMREMAAVAMARLEQRRSSPELPPTVSKIPVRLELPE
jgi:DNA-binding LacI/PurR family transcriptional regulator